MLNKPAIGRLEYFFYAYIIAAVPSGYASYLLNEMADNIMEQFGFFILFR